MDKLQLIALLQRVDLFHSLTTDMLEKLIDCSTILPLKHKQTLFSMGAAGDSMFIILKGQIDISHNQVLINTLFPSEYLGELSLIDPEPRSATATAVGDSLLMNISKAAFDDLVAVSPTLLLTITRSLIARVRILTNQMSADYLSVNHLIHDIRNKLNSLSGAEIVAKRIPKKDGTCCLFLKHITSTSADLTEMLDNALRNAKGNRSHYHKAYLPIDKLLHECLDVDLALHNDLQHIHVVVHPAEKIQPIALNGIEMKRVFANLILNAAQASAKDQHIDIEIQQDPIRTWVAIKDYGCGIPEDHLSIIFENHFTSKKNGSGFGLPSCVEIIEKHHGGKIQVSSILGLGTTFSVEIPNHGDVANGDSVN